MCNKYCEKVEGDVAQVVEGSSQALSGFTTQSNLMVEFFARACESDLSTMLSIEKKISESQYLRETASISESYDEPEIIQLEANEKQVSKHFVSRLWSEASECTIKKSQRSLLRKSYADFEDAIDMDDLVKVISFTSIEEHDTS